VRFKPPVQGIGHRRTHSEFKAGVRHVAVENHGILLVQQIDHRLPERVRGRKVGIAQAEIILHSRAETARSAILRPSLKHGADGAVVLRSFLIFSKPFPQASHGIIIFQVL
jgi:hypothetical protein